jgi:phosphatidylglycerophosphate synthase
VSLLGVLGVTANTLSVLQVLLALISMGIMQRIGWLAFMLLLVGGLLDALDGELARYLDTASEYGYLIDNVCDHTREIVGVSAMAHLGILQPIWAVFYTFLFLGYDIIIIQCNRRGVRLKLGQVKVYLAVVPTMALYFWGGINWLSTVFSIVIMFMTAASLEGLIRLKPVMISPFVGCRD